MVCEVVLFLLASLLAAPQLVRKHLGKHSLDEPYTHFSVIIEF